MNSLFEDLINLMVAPDINEGSIYNPRISYLILEQKRKSPKLEDILESGGLDDSRISFENRKLLSLLTSFRYDFFEIAGQFDMDSQAAVIDYLLDRLNLKKIGQQKIAQLFEKIDLLMAKCLKRRDYKDFVDAEHRIVSAKYYDGSKDYKRKVLRQYELAEQEQDTYEGAFQFLTCLKGAVKRHIGNENITDLKVSERDKLINDELRLKAEEIGDKLMEKGWLSQQPVSGVVSSSEMKATPHLGGYLDIKDKHFAESELTVSRTPTPDPSSSKGSSNIPGSIDDSKGSSLNSTPPSSPTKNREADASGSRKNSASSPSSTPKKTRKLDSSHSGHSSDFSDDDSKRSSSTATPTPPPSPKKSKNLPAAAKQQNNNEAKLSTHPKSVLVQVSTFTRFWWWMAGKLGIKTAANKYSGISVSNSGHSPAPSLSRAVIDNSGAPDGKVNKQKSRSAVKNPTVLIHSARGVVGVIRNKTISNKLEEKKTKVYQAASGQKFRVRSADTASVEPNSSPVPFTLHKQKAGLWKRFTSFLSAANPQDSKRLMGDKADADSKNKDVKASSMEKTPGHEGRREIVL